MLVLFWEGIHRLIRSHVNAMAVTSAFAHKHRESGSMYSEWWHFLGGESFVLLLVILSCWLLWHVGWWEFWHAYQFQWNKEIHMPVDARDYKDCAFRTAMHLT